MSEDYDCDDVLRGVYAEFYHDVMDAGEKARVDDDECDEALVVKAVRWAYLKGVLRPARVTLVCPDCRKTREEAMIR